MAKNKIVSVVGLGKMGFRLAELLIRHGYRVNVWNRTMSKAAPLIEQGAVAAISFQSAFNEGDIVVICVHDYAVIRQLLSTLHAGQQERKKTVINLTTGNGREAIELAGMVESRGHDYIDGAIFSVPEQMGQPETIICASGKSTAYKEVLEVLKSFGGNIKYAGESPDASATVDQAILFLMYGAFVGLFQGITMAERSGIDLSMFGELMEQVGLGMMPFLRYETEVIKSGDFITTQSPMSINISAVQRLHDTARELKLDMRFPALLNQYFTDAHALEYSDKELASLVEVFRIKA